MTLITLIFLFILYCILEGTKYSRTEIEEKEKKLKEKKILNKDIVYIKTFVYLLFFILLIVRHFTDPLSESSGLKGLLSLLLISSVFLAICIRDLIKVRRGYEKK